MALALLLYPLTLLLLTHGTNAVSCTNGAVKCGTNEVCGKIKSVVGCICDPSKPKLNPDIYDAIQTCDSESGLVDLSRCQLFEAGILYDDLHLQDESCKGTVNDNRVLITFNNNNRICGGTFQSNATHLIYNNLVSSVSGTITHNTTVHMSISCAYPLIQKISMPKSFQVTGGLISKELPSAEGTYQVLMQAYPDNSYTSPLNGSVTLNMNQKIFMDVTVVGFDSTKISTVLDSCWATHIDNINDTIRWNLITNECPDPMESSVNILQNGVSTSSHFSFNMFTFSGFSDSIHLHCQVHLCLLQGNTCTPSCGKKRRRRRVKNFHDTAAITMSF